MCTALAACSSGGKSTMWVSKRSGLGSSGSLEGAGIRAVDNQGCRLANRRAPKHNLKNTTPPPTHQFPAHAFALQPRRSAPPRLKRIYPSGPPHRHPGQRGDVRVPSAVHAFVAIQRAAREWAPPILPPLTSPIQPSQASFSPRPSLTLACARGHAERRACSPHALSRPWRPGREPIAIRLADPREPAPEEPDTALARCHDDVSSPSCPTGESPHPTGVHQSTLSVLPAAL